MNLDATIVCHTKWDESSRQHEFVRAEWVGGKRAGISVELVALADPVFVELDARENTLRFGDLNLKVIGQNDTYYIVEQA